MFSLSLSQIKSPFGADLPTKSKFRTDTKRSWYLVCVRLLIVASLLGFSLCATAEEVGANDAIRIDLQTNERTREYYLYAPKTLKENTSERALVIVFHGGGGTADYAIREVGDSLFRLAEEDGFYVVIPSAVNKIWDFGAGTVSENLEDRIDDYSYFENILDDVSARLPIDQERIFATGISRGGQAAYYIACQFPERIRAIAPIAMPLPTYLKETCDSGPPVGIALMNGTEDPAVPYDGGKIGLGKVDRDEVISTADTIELWRNRNGCESKLSAESVINPERDGMHVEKSEWRDCAGAPVVLYRIVGGGHTWPSGLQYFPRFLIGGVNMDIDGSEAAWGFFQEFR